MKMHTTNYYNTFIEIAPDCPIEFGEAPPQKNEKKTAANLQFELVSKNPYQFTSDEVLFAVFAQKKDLVESELETERESFFSKGQPCFRASPLTKRYGWGVHFNATGKMAIYSSGSAEYRNFKESNDLTILKAMKSAK